MYKKVYVEITNICNLKCSFCIKNKRKEEYLELEKFELILDKLKDHTKYLYFHILGEPLMHPLINEFISKASLNYFVNITTNGYLINKIKDNKNIRQINISLHSYDKKYNISLNEYMNNIFNTIDSLKTNTYISLRIWLKNKYSEEILNIIAQRYNKEIISNNETLEKNVFLCLNKKFIWPDLTNKFEEENGTCYALKDHIGILVDGTIVPCCLDTKGDIPLGNIYKDEIDIIIQSKRYKKMLNGFKNDKKVELLCRKCNFL
ncbi:MAG: SPASM domain-containing protein [Bacilli bacterium]|nr:SPASM domain-containing protein [Bacilli bacterium]MDD4733743.1 SPASM domain-containing protein [Bacilli bacterium]